MTAYDIAARLPAIDELRKRCKATAVLERIIVGGAPYYAYTARWGPDEAASMSNGSGDEWTIVFTSQGAFIRVFDHESAMSPYGDADHELWPGLLDGLPEALHPQVTEPAFCDETGQFFATAVLWRLNGDNCWRAGKGIDFPPLLEPYDDVGPDGSGMLDILLDDIVDRFVEFCGDYSDVPTQDGFTERTPDTTPWPAHFRRATLRSQDLDQRGHDGTPLLTIGRQTTATTAERFHNTLSHPGHF